uniref:Glycosyl transferase 64 domain-containing protein n=1 Tax=Ananas comosus var. bracteatus TaxID=296719 RepID=A0A6V7NFE3_ANACO|nr:unnamed protein product [Ananas comosus var. bracteatus]
MALGVALHCSPNRSLKARFLPRRALWICAVAVCDDDVALPPRPLSFALALFRSRSRSRPALIGFFGRAHDLDPMRRESIHAASDRYSILLAKFFLLPVPLLRRYSCALELTLAHHVVDRAPNCEDILMSFVAAVDGVELVLVEGKGVRDWGNPRNRPCRRQRGSCGCGWWWRQRQEHVRRRRQQRRLRAKEEGGGGGRRRRRTRKWRGGRREEEEGGGGRREEKMM